MNERAQPPRHGLHIGTDADVTNVLADGHRVTIINAHRPPVELCAPDEDIALILAKMARRPVAEAVLRRHRASHLIFAMLDVLCEQMLVSWSAFEEGGAAITIASRSENFRFDYAPPPVGRLVLSRFALMRRANDRAVLESSETAARVTFAADADKALARLWSGISHDTPLACGLWGAGFLEVADAHESNARKSWEFHDHLFHAHSSGVFDREVSGATHPQRGTLPPPARKPEMPGERVELPPVQQLGAGGSPLHETVKRRRSMREPGARPLSLPELGQFLWRTSRTLPSPPDGQEERLRRPYPSAGALHELECYVVNNRCQAISRAIFHYNGFHHVLTQMACTGEAAERIVAVSARVMGGVRPPDVVIVVTSRMPRVSWKYGKIAYRLTLLNAGVLLQTMALTATDMGLAGCPNGLGDYHAFQLAAGLDRWEEVAVAAFALSGAPA
ncbi:MAG: SagB family peptide dehydrogenase [Pseudomonadota bacterium]